MSWILALALLAAPAAAPSLEQLAAALRASPGWQVEFVQTYTPEGFDEGTSEPGTLTLAPPARLRFDYAGASPRVFAVDGSVARLVDPGNASCEATRLDQGAWARLPLAAILDPAAAERTFAVEASAGRLRLVPREKVPELAEVVIGLDGGTLPHTVLVRDASGNRNQFALTRWKPIAAPAAALFAPSLPGKAPCRPEG
ncbi:MAG TPA: outer membrane lipoprotein carrier protein LolA [Thermoanaerobaculaceae bacterium]|nr:outer membrane lipoprotein carrier protein LolA [Thermoanaerobaculaceae bacterium]